MSRRIAGPLPRTSRPARVLAAVSLSAALVTAGFALPAAAGAKKPSACGKSDTYKPAGAGTGRRIR